MPSATEEAGKLLAEAGLTDRCETVSGDFFKSVPGGADAYLLKSVIHDWDDDRSIAIPRNCRRAVPAHGKLLLLERVLPGRVEASAEHREALLVDMHMLVATGGCERTETEFRAIYGAAGFRLTELVPLGQGTAASFHVIVGVPD